MSVKSIQNLVGKKVGPSQIDSLIGEGMFSWVFKCVDATGNITALKVAKPTELAGEFTTAGVPATTALEFHTGGSHAAQPDPSDLLCKQFEALSTSKSPVFVVAHEMLDLDGLTGYSMEYCPGNTLRKRAADATLTKSQLLAVIYGLSSAFEKDGCAPHFDIKPDNIIVSEAGPRIVDPGYLGPLPTTDGYSDHLVVTTQGYYPGLVQDDLLALGITIWEMICRRHPLGGVSYSPYADKSGASDDLIKYVQHHEQMGHYIFAPLLQLQRPSELVSGLTERTDAVLAKCIRLRFNNEGKRDLDPGYSSFAELADAVSTLSPAELGLTR